MDDTRSGAYARRLQTLSTVRWKRLLDVQAPYRWNLRRQVSGRTLDVGCGIGRNLVSLSPDSVGVDHNAESVALARSRGLIALTVDEWADSPLRQPGAFDSLLFAHVIEHLDQEAGAALVADYLPCLRVGGRVLFICPQERGYASDPTHVRFTDGAALEDLARSSGLIPENWRSFPLPRAAGRIFPYNEFTVVAHKPAEAQQDSDRPSIDRR